MTKVGARQSESDGCRLKTVLTALIYMKAPTNPPSFEGSGEGDTTSLGTGLRLTPVNAPEEFGIMCGTTNSALIGGLSAVSSAKVH